MEWVSVADAAEELGVSQRQVRRLAEAGKLSGRRLGATWLLSADSIAERVRTSIGAGRPVLPAFAWAVLAAAEAVLDGLPPGEAVEVAAEDLDDRRARHRLRKVLADPPDPTAWDHWLRRRAEPRRVWVHPGVLDQMGEDPRLHVGGAAAAVGHGGAHGTPDRFYLAERDVEAVARRYRARVDEDGRSLLLVVPDDLSRYLGDAGEPVLAIVGFVDCVNAEDARERHNATTALEKVVRQLAAGDDG